MEEKCLYIYVFAMKCTRDQAAKVPQLSIEQDLILVVRQQRACAPGRVVVFTAASQDDVKASTVMPRRCHLS
jgi:hypothetical protein